MCPPIFLAGIHLGACFVAERKLSFFLKLAETEMRPVCAKSSAFIHQSNKGGDSTALAVRLVMAHLHENTHVYIRERICLARGAGITVLGFAARRARRAHCHRHHRNKYSVS